jgi:penicillin V acylase-like amidase (Ntn superfamily)
MMHRRSFLAGLLATPFTFKAEELLACSRVFINDRKLAKIVVRSMDLPLSIPERPKFFVFPRGMARSSDNSVIPGIRAKVEGIGSNFVRWTSRLGNVVMTGFDGAATDGLNENGLAAHVLELGESQHEPKDDRSELPDSHWAQYVLDTFATVKDVVDAHNAGKFRVVAAWSTELGYLKPLGLHLAVEDASGDSAIFEFVKGKLVIHHGPEYRVMTNDPTLDEMLVRMKKYKEFGGTEELPGSLKPEYRFARLAAYYKYLPDPKNYTEAVAGAMSLLRIAQVPFRDPARVPADEQGPFAGIQTNWVSAADVTNDIYYVNSATVPSLFWLELKKVNFSPRAPVMFLNPHDPKIGGDARRHLRRWKAPT